MPKNGISTHLKDEEAFRCILTRMHWDIFIWQSPNGFTLCSYLINLYCRYSRILWGDFTWCFKVPGASCTRSHYYCQEVGKTPKALIGRRWASFASKQKSLILTQISYLANSFKPIANKVPGFCNTEWYFWDVWIRNGFAMVFAFIFLN